MRLLLDTHVAIWVLSAPEYLAAAERDMISDRANDIHISAVTVLEIAIKHALKRRTAPPFSAREATVLFREAGFLFVDVTVRHAEGVEALPPIHADPFDRLIVAQALAEPLCLVTHDAKVKAYHSSIILF